MKINIHNKEYDAVEVIGCGYTTANNMLIEGKFYNLTEANPLQEKLEGEFEEWSERFTDAYGQGHVVETRFCELENYPALKEKVSSLIIKALNV